MFINKLGDISINTPVLEFPHVYTFVHDFSEPICNHYSSSNEIKIEKQTENSIQFCKKYDYFSLNANLEHNIQIQENDIFWDIVSKDSVPEYRFGISILVDDVSIQSIDGVTQESLINYTKDWKFQYSNQRNVNIPIIRFQSQNKTYDIGTHFETDVQFFYYMDGEKRYLKISTVLPEIFLNIRISSTIKDDIRNSYLYFFPMAHKLVFPTTNQISKKYNVKITNYQSVNILGFQGSAASEDETNSGLEILNNCLNFYPNDILNKIGIKRIHLFSEITDGQDVLHGLYDRGSLLWNVSSKINEFEKAKSFHHEIYHAIEKCYLNIETVNKEWNNTPDCFSKIILSPRIESPNEYRAELFAYWVIDPNFVYSIITKDEFVFKKLKIVHEIFSGLGSEYRDIIINYKIPSEPQQLIYLYIKDYWNSSKKEIILPKMSDRHLLSFLDHSYVSDFLSIFAKYEIDRFDIESVEKFLETSNGSSLFITINPLDYCIQMYEQNKIHAFKSFEYWMGIHQKLINKKICFIHSEWLHSGNFSILKTFLNSTFGVSINTQEMPIIDPRPYSIEGVPGLNFVWNKYRRHPTIAKLGYIFCSN